MLTRARACRFPCSMSKAPGLPHDLYGSRHSRDSSAPLEGHERLRRVRVVLQHGRRISVAQTILAHQLKPHLLCAGTLVRAPTWQGDSNKVDVKGWDRCGEETAKCVYIGSDTTPWEESACVAELHAG